MCRYTQKSELEERKRALSLKSLQLIDSVILDNLFMFYLIFFIVKEII